MAWRVLFNYLNATLLSVELMRNCLQPRTTRQKEAPGWKREIEKLQWKTTTIIKWPRLRFFLASFWRQPPYMGHGALSPWWSFSSINDGLELNYSIYLADTEVRTNIRPHDEGLFLQPTKKWLTFHANSAERLYKDPIALTICGAEKECLIFLTTTHPSKW